MGGEDNRRRQRLEPVDHPQQFGPEMAALRRGEAVEDVDVDAGGGGAARGADQDRPRRRRGKVFHRGLEVIDHPLVEEVQRRAVEGEDREAVLVLDPDGFLALGHRGSVLGAAQGLAGTRWTSNRFVPSSCPSSPAVIATRSPGSAMW